VNYNISSNISLRGTFTLAHGFGRLTDSPFPVGPTGNEFGFGFGSGPVTGFVEYQVNPDSFRFATLANCSVALTQQVNKGYNYTIYYQSAAAKSHNQTGPYQSDTAKPLGHYEFSDDAHLNGQLNPLNCSNNLFAGPDNRLTSSIEWEQVTVDQE